MNPERCRFEDVLPVWRNELWPNRQSPIESHSAMKWLGGIDTSLMQSKASFWRFGAISPMAVLSGHFGGIIDASCVGLSTNEKSYRTRGLWVPEEMRRHGVARKLMDAAFAQARIDKCLVVWTFPRISSLPFYKSMGFIQVGEKTADGEFGPNCYAIVKL